jgi:hypothetical protein
MNIRWNRGASIHWVAALAGSSALFLSLAVLVDAVLRGVLESTTPLPLDGTSILELGGAYSAGALVAVFCATRLMARARRRADAVLACAVAALPLLVAIRVAVEGISEWTAGDMLRLAILALLVGLVTGGPRSSAPAQRRATSRDHV